MLSTCATDEMLCRLFQRHFPDPVSALLRLEKHLAAVPLSFDVRKQLRELEFRPHAGCPDGSPSLIYYFLPKSGWGSNNPAPANPLHADFVYATDGLCLNMGCPVRLLRALDILSRLRPEDQTEIKNNLANPTQHFAAVEELLWATVWKSLSQLRRGGSIPGGKGNVDWSFESSGHPLFVEAKFRQSDWPRLSDKGTFTPMTGSFLGKAAPKFPHPPHAPALYIVGITVFENLTEPVLNQIGQELLIYPQIHVVIFTALTQMTHVISLNPGLRDPVFRLLAKPSVKEYPTNYLVPTHIEQRDRRISERAKTSATPMTAPTGICCWPFEPELDIPIRIIGDQYRLDILSRGSDGEPQFHVIPRFHDAK